MIQRNNQVSYHLQSIWLINLPEPVKDELSRSGSLWKVKLKLHSKLIFTSSPRPPPCISEEKVVDTVHSSFILSHDSSSVIPAAEQSVR